MRVVNWAPDKITSEIEKRAMDRLEKAGKSVAEIAKTLVPIGKDRLPYRNGQKWSARKAGALRDTIRVVRLANDAIMNVRVYAGNTEVYYARWVEMGSVHNDAPRKPFLRPALNATKSRIKFILENG